ncbi:MAG: amino acid adenylation domain-containing protein, partial [bacterium]|nr:amino acid adenylation domain-containing protein [bacterium]
TFSTSFPITRRYEGRIPIGFPITNSSAYILDNNYHLQPVNVAGELWVGGEGVARGYLNRPALTATKFNKDFKDWPDGQDLRKEQAAVIYRTGDLARWLEDGSIDFIGRIDHQVKIRGFRIEIGEIENQLLDIDGITEAIVVLRTDQGGEKYLCGYIVSEHEKDPQEVAEELGKRLPDYMIPPYLVSLDKLPLNANGKVDRPALPLPRIETGDQYSAPLDEVEQDLADIWAGVLDLDRNIIGREANFFRMGGHSLKAAALVARIHHRMEVKIPLTEIFINQTLQTQADFIKQSGKTRYSHISLAEIKEYYPLSSAQKRLFLLQQLFTLDQPDTGLNPTVYNMPLVFSLGKDIEKEKLEPTLKQLIHRHESLRTSFRTVNEVPVQMIHDAGELKFSIEYYSEGSTDVMARFVRPFDLSRAPLIRSGLLELPDGNHLWMVDMHHIISDGTSHAVLEADFKNLYSGIETVPLKLQYKDFSEWQNRLFETHHLQSQQEYWLGIYRQSGEIPRLELPLDHKRPGVFTYAGAAYQFKLEPGDFAKFKTLGPGTGESATLFMNMLAILNTLFYKITGQEDIIIGTASAGRPHADLQPIIGMFVNTLAMRNYPKGEKNYQTLLKEIMFHSARAFQNQDIQFEELVDKLEIQRDTSRNPLFDVLLGVQNFNINRQPEGTGNNSNDHSLDAEYGNYTNTTAKFDMTFYVREFRDDIYINLEYYSPVFDEETIHRLVSHLKNIIKAVCNEPTVRLRDIEIITEEEKQKVLYEFNDTAREYPKEKTIHQLFGEEAKKSPDHIAVIVEQDSFTYETLNKRSDHLARQLTEQGVKPDTIVGITAERSFEMIIGILGILKAGGAYLPIDPDYPEERINYMLRDSGTSILLRKHSTEYQSTRYQDHLPTFPPSNPSSLAYIIYTSGSTGTPKGVMVEHHNVVRLVKNTNYIRFETGDRVLQTGTLAFDASTFEIWGALLSGLTLCLASKEKILAPGSLKRLVRNYGIRTMWLTAPLFNQLVQMDTGIFSGLGNLLVGGDVLSPLHINRVIERFPQLNVINGYGPTENTTFSTTYRITRPFTGPIPIGQPIANSFALILNPYHRPQPIDITGELCVGGDGIARGYLNNPELTAEKFVSAMNYIYKTGDLARWRADGNIEFSGRKDQQVKIRGFRVEPGEIENRLRNLDQVKEAVVVDLRDEQGQRYLAAYIVAGPGDGGDEFRAMLSGFLPDYMIPAYFVSLEKIPLTPNGKVDKNALPKPGAFVPGEDFTAPRGPLEHRLVDLWREVLFAGDGENPSTVPIGIDQNFFHLGGHSLNATVLVSKIHKEWGVTVPLLEVFKNDTIRSLSRYIKGAAKTRYSRIEPVEKQEYYRISSAQKRIYVLQQMDLENTAYNMPLVLPLAPGTEPSRLENVFNRLIARHESLRTSFATVDNQTVQKVHDKVEFTIEGRGDPLWSPLHGNHS